MVEILSIFLAFRVQLKANCSAILVIPSSIGSIIKGATQENIYMELLPDFQNHSDAPEKLYLATAEGDNVPFKAFAEVEREAEFATYRTPGPASGCHNPFFFSGGYSP